MQAPIDETIKRRVVQQWLSGEPRDKIAADNNIGAGTVSSIVDNYKIGLDYLDLDSFRELMVEAKKRSMTPSDLAAHFRLFHYIVKSGAAEDKIESFIVNINSGYIPLEKVIELVNQIYQISKSDSVPPDQLPNYIKQKLEEKQRIDEQIKEADAILQTKNVKAKTINEHVKLNEKLNKYGLSTQDINKLVKLLINAKRYGFDAKKIVGKLSNIKELEKKEKGLRGSCLVLSKQIAKDKETIPLAELIRDAYIGRSELISFKIAINEAAEMYGLTPSAAALHVINVIKDYNERGQLKKELSDLNFQKYAISQFCSSHSDAIMALLKLQSYGVTEDQILLYVNRILER